DDQVEQPVQLHRALVEEGILRLRDTEVDQILDQLLQAADVGLQDAHDLALTPVEGAGYLVVQQLDTLAQRGERRLELVRDVAQDRYLVLLEGAQALAQPVELPPEVLEVARPPHLRNVAHVALAERADGARELANRPVDEAAVHGRQYQRG